MRSLGGVALCRTLFLLITKHMPLGIKFSLVHFNMAKLIKHQFACIIIKSLHKNCIYIDNTF